MRTAKCVVMLTTYTYCHSILETVTPLRFSFTRVGVLAVNGSMENGGCPDDDISDENQQATCNSPTSSVLFDGVTPTLTELDGDTWAEQLMVLDDSQRTSLQFEFNFMNHPTYTGVTRVEVALFNCPEWQTGLDAIEFSQTGDGNQISASTIRTQVNESSCDALINVCIMLNYRSELIRLSLELPTGATYAHLAEVTFYSSRQSFCPLPTTAAKIPPHQGM